jgi:hypothetical protein
MICYYIQENYMRSHHISTKYTVGRNHRNEECLIHETLCGLTYRDDDPQCEISMFPIGEATCSVCERTKP